MRLKDILRQKGSEVVTISADRTVHDAVVEMNAHRIGALVVTGEAGEVVGVISERDVLRMCGENCALAEQPKHVPRPMLVKDIMSTDLVIGFPNDEIGYAMAVMTNNRIRHLPIMDEGSLVGMVSIGDVVRAHLSEASYENRMLKDYIQGVTR